MTQDGQEKVLQKGFTVIRKCNNPKPCFKFASFVYNYLGTLFNYKNSGESNWQHLYQSIANTSRGTTKKHHKTINYFPNFPNCSSRVFFTISVILAWSPMN